MQKGVIGFEDLKEGMMVTGKIKNVVDFGAFVDIGIKETALLHISELSDSYISDPMELLKVGDVKECRIIGLDLDRRRISLSLRSDSASRGSSGSQDGTQSGAAPGGEKKRVVRVAAKSGDGAAKPAGDGAGNRTENSGDNRSFRQDGGQNRGGYGQGNDNRGRQDRGGQDRGGNRYGSRDDDGMTYNPFAEAFKKMKK
jgi:uncharacterized protein